MIFRLVNVEISDVQFYLTKSNCSLITDNIDLTHLFNSWSAVSIALKFCADLELVIEHRNFH